MRSCMIEYILYFITGGLIVTSVIALARAGYPFLSGLALTFPAVTIVSFYFIGKSKGAGFVATTAKSSFLAALFIWMPYMLTIIYLAPKTGVNKALLAGFFVFLVFGSVWSWLYLSKNIF